MSEQQRARRRRQRQRRRQRRREEAPLVEGEVVEAEGSEDGGDTDDVVPQREPALESGPSRPNTVFGMPRFVFTMTMGVAAALLIVIILNQVIGPVSDDVEGVERFPDLGRRHLGAGEVFDGYNSVPATSGPQNVAGVPPGIYGELEPAPFDFVPQAAELLPVLESGGIVIHYRPDLVPDAEESLLRDFYDLALTGAPNLVLTTNAAIDDPIVVTAWGHLFPIAVVEEGFIEDLARFILDEDDGFYGRFVLETEPELRELQEPTLSPTEDAEADGAAAE